MQQPFAKFLQLVVDGQRQILARLGPTVKGTVLIAALNTTMGIAQENLDTFLAAQLFLIAALNAELADIVARLIVVVIFNVGRRHLGHIT